MKYKDEIATIDEKSYKLFTENTLLKSNLEAYEERIAQLRIENEELKKVLKNITIKTIEVSYGTQSFICKDYVGCSDDCEYCWYNFTKNI